MYFITSENKIYLYTSNGWEDYTCTANSGQISPIGDCQDSLSILDNIYSTNGLANQFYGLPESQVKCEKSGDGGSTWTDTTSTDHPYIMFFQNHTIRVESPDKTLSTDSRMRITIYAGHGEDSSEMCIYFKLIKLIIYICVNGHSGIWVKVEYRNGTTTSTDDWVTLREKVYLMGYPGNNSVYLSDSFNFGGYETQNQAKWLRLTFGCDYPSESGVVNPDIYFIRPISTDVWISNNFMQKYGIPYETINKVAEFDMPVKSSKFEGSLVGNASSSDISSAVSWEEYS